jgi:hypothetical protein
MFSVLHLRSVCFVQLGICVALILNCVRAATEKPQVHRCQEPLTVLTRTCCRDRERCIAVVRTARSCVTLCMF